MSKHFWIGFLRSLAKLGAGIVYMGRPRSIRREWADIDTWWGANGSRS